MTLQPIIRTYEDRSGETRISRLDSYMYHRHTGLYFKAKQEGYKRQDGTCAYCTPQLHQYMRTDNGVARCICWILEEEYDLKTYQEISSPCATRQMKDFQIWGEPDSQDQLMKAMDTVLDWLGNPDKWLVLAGGVGTGKSTLMSIIHTHFKPWSMYIVSPDFEQAVFDKTADRNLGDLTNIVSHHPILLLDDVGADYGSPYPISQVSKVINNRYTREWEYPTVISTNLSPSQLETYDKIGRFGDRVMDTEKSIVVSFSKVKSWRQYGPRK